MLAGGWRIEGRRFVDALTAAQSCDGRVPQREHRDLGRAVDPHRHVHRADAAADEERALLSRGLAGQHRELARRRWRRRRAARPGRRACGPTAPAARRAPRPRCSRRGSCASRIVVPPVPCSTCAMSRGAPRPEADAGEVQPLAADRRARVRWSFSTVKPAPPAPPACRGRRRGCRAPRTTPCGARQRRQQLGDRRRRTRDRRTVT